MIDAADQINFETDCLLDKLAKRRHAPQLVRKTYNGDQPNIPAAPSQSTVNYMTSEQQKVWDDWLDAHLMNFTEGSIVPFVSEYVHKHIEQLSHMIGQETGKLQRAQNDDWRVELDDMRVSIEALRFEVTQLRAEIREKTFKPHAQKKPKVNHDVV